MHIYIYFPEKRRGEKRRRQRTKEQDILFTPCSILGEFETETKALKESPGESTRTDYRMQMQTDTHVGMVYSLDITSQDDQ